MQQAEALLELMRKFRTAAPAVSLGMFTGYAENAVIGNGHLDQGMEILTKPFELAAFGHKVRDMIER